MSAAYLFFQIFVAARLKVLMYSFVHCAFSTRCASIWKKSSHGEKHHAQNLFDKAHSSAPITKH